MIGTGFVRVREFLESQGILKCFFQKQKVRESQGIHPISSGKSEKIFFFLKMFVKMAFNLSCEQRKKHFVKSVVHRTFFVINYMQYL